MKITESHLEPSNTIIEILNNIRMLEERTEIKINIDDYVALDESQVYEGAASLDIKHRQLVKDLDCIVSDITEKQDKSVELLRGIVINNFEEKLELFQIYKEIYPNLEFPVSDWYDHLEFENGVQYIKSFDLNLNRYSMDSYKLQQSILKYILNSQEYKNELNKIMIGKSDGFTILDEIIRDIKDLSWSIFNSKDKKLEPVSFFDMIKKEFGFPLVELKRYLFLKEFAKNPLELDSPELLSLSKNFHQPIPFMFLSEVKKMNIFSSNHFFLRDNSIKDSKLDSEEAKLVIRQSVVQHFLNIKQRFPSDKDNPITVTDITNFLFNQLERGTRQNIPNDVKKIILEEISLEILIPSKKQDNMKIVKF